MRENVGIKPVTTLEKKKEKRSFENVKRDSSEHMIERRARWKEKGIIKKK